MTSIETGTTSQTLHVDKDGVFYPCWCGEKHRGDYALERWLSHHCTHSSPLVRLTDPDTGQVICVDCGQVFNVEDVEA